MSDVTYLTTPIVEMRIDPPPRGSGMTREGYTKRSGAPTERMIRLQGEKRWRRLMVWQFSNTGTLFVKIEGKPHVVREEMLPAEGRSHHATKKSPAQLQREIDEALASPAGASGSGFTPPRTVNVVDKHGGFTAITRSGTLWRPGQVARGSTVGSLLPGSIKHDDFYQNNQPVTSALYKLPGYNYKVKIWWKPSGERIA